MKRYKIIQGSQSAHCCFDFTIVDTEKPVTIGDQLYKPDGIQQYEEVCECFFEKDANLICDALNSKEQK
jgi:hypothetical protein